MNSTVKQLLMWVLVITGAIGLFIYVSKGMGGPKPSVVSYTDLLDKAQTGQVKTATVDGSTVTGQYANNDAYTTTKPENDQRFWDIMTSKNGVHVTVKDANSNVWWNTLISILPFALLLGLWFFLLRQMQSGGNKAMSFGKSRARLLSMQQKKITFKDVAGVDEAKEELKEIIEFLREAQKFQRLGGRIPKGVLLVGPPGTGKTLLARAVAGEANVPFFSISGSDFVEMFVGVGASRVRDLFEQGKKNAPCIIFIDEIDAVGTSPWRRSRRRT